MANILKVQAFWDDEAGVFVAESDDVPGLVAEAATVELLLEKLKVLIPELLEANGLPDGGEVPFKLVSEVDAVAPRIACC